MWIGDTAEFRIKSATGAIKIPGLELPLIVRQKRNAYRVEELLALAKKRKAPEPGLKSLPRRVKTRHNSSINYSA